MRDVNEITIYDLARELDLSASTVSRALNRDNAVTNKVSPRTKRRIFDLATARGYHTNTLAQNLQKGSTRSIGIVVPHFNDCFTAAVVASIEEVIGDNGYNLALIQSGGCPEEEVRATVKLFNNRVDGVIAFISDDTGNLEHFEKFAKKNVPVVLLNWGRAKNGFTEININNKKAAYELTRHLLQQRCRRVAYLTAYFPSPMLTQRFEGYKAALEDDGAAFENKLVIKTSMNRDGGYKAAGELMQLAGTDRPDAIFAASDETAAGCLVFLKEMGIKVPKEMVVAGFGNDIISNVVEPRLTTVNCQPDKIGEVAALAMLKNLQGIVSANAGSAILFEIELIIRESSLKNLY